MQEEEACPWSLNTINRRAMQLHNLWCIQISINDLRLQQICCLFVSCLKCVVLLQHPLMQWFSKCSVGNPMFPLRGSRRQTFIFIRIPSMFVVTGCNTALSEIKQAKAKFLSDRAPWEQILSNCGLLSNLCQCRSPCHEKFENLCSNE